MVKAAYVQSGDEIDHTPGAAIAAGDVVVLGSQLVCIAKRAIAADELGALATRGVYEAEKDSSTFTIGEAVYWDDDGDPVDGEAGSGAFTDDPTKGPFAGWAVAAAATGAEKVLFKLESVDDQAAVARSALVQDDLQPYGIPLTALRVHDALHTTLPGTAANDDMALVTGTLVTDAPTVQGVDFGGASTDEKAAFEFTLPPEYVAGQSITAQVTAGMLVVSDGTATIDVECWKAASTGAVGLDLCATAAQSINSATHAAKDFTITPTGLAAGDRLLFRLSFGGSDVGNAAPNITPEITDVRILLDVKG